MLKPQFSFKSLLTANSAMSHNSQIEFSHTHRAHNARITFSVVDMTYLKRACVLITEL